MRRGARHSGVSRPCGTSSASPPCPRSCSCSAATGCSRSWKAASPMSPNGSITTEHVWKRFRADIRYSKLQYEIRHLRSILRGEGEEAWRWALRDVDFVGSPGEAGWFVGTNGSRKAALLQ